MKYQDSIHRIEDINEGDFIAAMYEKPYYGLVTKKTKSHSGDSILVQFYTRSDKHDVFIEKKGDVDRITQERQGYIFLHALAHEVVMSKTKSGKQKCFVIQEYTPEDFDLGIQYSFFQFCDKATFIQLIIVSLFFALKKLLN